MLCAYDAICAYCFSKVFVIMADIMLNTTVKKGIFKGRSEINLLKIILISMLANTSKIPVI